MTISDVFTINNLIIALSSDKLRERMPNFESEEERLLREVMGLNDYFLMKINNNEIDSESLEEIFTSLDCCVQNAAYRKACRVYGVPKYPSAFIQSLKNPSKITNGILEGASIISKLLNNKKEMRRNFERLKDISNMFSEFGLSIFDIIPNSERSRILKMYSEVEKEFQNI